MSEAYLQYNTTYTSSQQDVFIVLSSISCVLPMSYVISYYVFYQQMAKRTSNDVLLYVFISNILTSLGSSVGLPYQSNFACWWEGILTNIFTLSAILWTVVLTLLLYSIIGFERPIKITWPYHAICWGIPIIVTFIPLINSTYGPPQGQGWCWIVDKPDGTTPAWAGAVWFWLSYYLWLWGGFIAIVVLFSTSLIRASMNLPAATLANFKKALLHLGGFPLIILICWVPGCYTDSMSYEFNMYISDTLAYNTAIIAVLMGSLFTLNFWVFDDHVISNWKDLSRNGFSLSKMESERRTVRAGGIVSSKKSTKKGPSSSHVDDHSSHWSVASTRSVHDSVSTRSIAPNTDDILEKVVEFPSKKVTSV